MHRKFPRPIKRVVIKVGSSVIATDQMKPRMAHLRSLIGQISLIRQSNVDVILVSSGAIVLGMGELNRTQRSTDLASLQALAAIGQAVLMRRYNELFKRNKLKCAQVLLTWDDFDNRLRHNNARHTLNTMLAWGVIPVINENDTVSTEEIKFGDNDRLSALVASLVQADLLIILSDVEGLYDLKGTEKKLFQEIKEITWDIEGAALGHAAHQLSQVNPAAKKQMSKGGMAAKLNAVKIATQARIPCIIANGETENVIERILMGERIGTLFMEREDKLLSRRHWISFGAKPKGIVLVDDGAKQALLSGGKSLLLPGVISWEGHFKKDDVIVVQDKARQEIARGISNYSSSGLTGIQEKKGQKELIHRDNLVLCER
ncbi:MAG: glutamate 5-kinase [Omnitrophica WOR_2 bacterium RIFCSPHIGHO2_02_FULL_52_10]|nr:MAG: glutamate 5-kinase [Omnitrophica WOR_2 bacterium RIFCSPHIGHO2_02_FULL_52_10]